MTTIVLFCDICNESVPQSDVDSGRARMLKGRVVCSVCERSMSHDPATEASPASFAGAGGAPIAASTPSPSPSPPPAPAPTAVPIGGPETALRTRPRRDAGALVGASLAFMAVLAALAIGWKLNGRIEESQESYDQSLRAAIRDYRVEALGVRQTAEALRQENNEFLASLQRELDRFGEDLAAADRRWKHENELVMTELTDFDTELSGMKELVGLIQRHDKEMVGLQAKFATLLDDITQLTVRTSALEERPVVMLADAGGAGGAETDPNGTGADGDQPSWANLLKGLESPNADERWMAVDELGQTGDPAVAGPLLRMLQDEDTFVRMATARILGDLDAPIGIPALIEALDDAEPAVREAAMVALQAITGKTFDFDPHAGPADRAKRVKSWRQWWEKSKDDWLPEE